MISPRSPVSAGRCDPTPDQPSPACIRTAFSAVSSQTPIMCKDHTRLTWLPRMPIFSCSSCLASPTPDRRVPHTLTGMGILRWHLLQCTRNCLSSVNWDTAALERQGCRHDIEESIGGTGHRHCVVQPCDIQLCVCRETDHEFVWWQGVKVTAWKIQEKPWITYLN